MRDAWGEPQRRRTTAGARTRSRSRTPARRRRSPRSGTAAALSEQRVRRQAFFGHLLSALTLPDGAMLTLFDGFRIASPEDRPDVG